MFRALIFTLVFTVLSTVSADAGNSAITKEMVAQKYNELEKILNNRSDYVAAVQFLHSHISDDARFRLTVANPTVSGSKNGPAMDMNKQDYINTYIQGSQYVEGYQMNIRMAGFEYDPSTQSASSKEIMIERGTVPGINSSKPFVSRTTCETKHELRENTLVSTESECHTDISYEEEV